MNRLAIVLFLAGVAAGCAAPARNMEQVQPGMTSEQVQAIMGPPQAVTYAPGKQCAYYALLKDFWSRVPWSINERYYVCYDDGKVASFGKVDAMT